MTRRSHARDSYGVTHVLLPALPKAPPSTTTMCNATTSRDADGPATCMTCIGIDMHIARTAEFINNQLADLVGKQVDDISLGEIAARLLRPPK